MKIDGRTIDHKALEEMRKIAVRRVKEYHESPSEVIKAYGFCRTTIYKWLARAEEGGMDNLAAKPIPGRPQELTHEQCEKVRVWINGKDPRQYGFDFGLWTRQLIVDLVREKFGQVISVWTAGRVLERLGITPQKPLRRAYERDANRIEDFKSVEYPEIKKRAKKEGADIFFLDEAGVRNDDPLGRTWAPRGKKPVVKTSGRRQSINALSAVNENGAFWYRTYKETLNADRMIEFLGDFLKGRKRPVILIVDNHPVHRSKAVAEWVKARTNRIELVFLPPYAPELNPDEMVWNYLKTNDIRKRPLRKNESLVERVQAALDQIKKTPALIKSFFQAAEVAYLHAN